MLKGWLLYSYMKALLRRDDDEGRHEAVMCTAQLWVCEEAKVSRRGQGVGVYLGKSG